MWKARRPMRWLDCCPRCRQRPACSSRCTTGRRTRAASSFFARPRSSFGPRRPWWPVAMARGYPIRISSPTEPQRAASRPIRKRCALPASELDSSARREQHAQLAPDVAGAVREEELVVTACAARADRDPSHAERTRVGRDDLAEIHAHRASDVAAEQAARDLWADLVAPSADRWAAVEAQLPSGEPKGVETTDRALDDTRLGASPP